MAFFLQKLFGYPQMKKILVESGKVQRELLWAEIFNSTIKNSAWFTHQSISPGRWALGYPACYITYRILNDIKPGRILEFGLGESTKLTYQYVKNHTDTNLTVIEQNQEWLEFFSRQIFDVREYVKIHPVEEVPYKDANCFSYKNLLPSLLGNKFDFVFIDGPWGSDKYSRNQIVEVINNDLLSDDFIIVMDDYERIGERQTMEIVKESLKSKGVSFAEGIYAGVKETYIICTSKFSFLNSL